MRRINGLGLLSAVSAALFVVVGCGGGRLHETNSAVKEKMRQKVVVSRSVAMDLDPELTIYCQKADVNIPERTVKIEGIVTMHGTDGESNNLVAKSMEIVDNTLVIKLDSGTPYVITVERQEGDISVKVEN